MVGAQGMRVEIPHDDRECEMAANSYAIAEIVGTSKTGVDDAIRGALESASRSIEGLDWFEVTEIRGHIEGQEIAHFQVTVKVGSRLDESSS